jgi:hypothetical protein
LTHTFAPAFAQATTGGLAGCITPKLLEATEHGQLAVVEPRVPLPGIWGVTVVARTSTIRQTTVTNREGCYSFESLPPAVYRITAHESRFDNETREKVTVEAGKVTRADLQMKGAAICECIESFHTPDQLWDLADVVVHVRITDHHAQLPAPPGYFRHTAETVEILKPHPDDGPTGAPMTFLQSQRRGEPAPYWPGEELTLFLYWDREAGGLTSVHRWVVPVEDHDIGRDYRDALLARLREIAAAR